MLTNLQPIQAVSDFLKSSNQSTLVSCGSTTFTLWKMTPLCWPDELSHLQVMVGGQYVDEDCACDVLLTRSLSDLCPLFVFNVITGEIVYLTSNYNLRFLLDSETGCLKDEEAVQFERLSATKQLVAVALLEAVQEKIEKTELSAVCNIPENHLDTLVMQKYVRSGCCSDPDSSLDVRLTSELDRYLAVFDARILIDMRFKALAQAHQDLVLHYIGYRRAWKEHVAALIEDGALTFWQQRRDVYAAMRQLEQNRAKSVKVVFEDADGSKEYSATIDGIMHCCLFDGDFNLANHWGALSTVNMSPRFDIDKERWRSSVDMTKFKGLKYCGKYVYENPDFGG